MNKIKSNDPKIVSITYSFSIERSVYNKLLKADLNQELCLTDKLKKSFPEMVNTSCLAKVLFPEAGKPHRMIQNCITTVTT